MKPSFLYVLLTLFFSASFLSPSVAQPVTLESLVREMTDRDALARFPALNYQVKQFSSYDREATGPNQPNWFANADRTQFLRKEMTANGTEWVLFDDQGPGAIVRFWMTFAGEGSGEGTMRIYIDGAAKPTVEGSAFDILSGHQLVGPPLSTSVSELTPYRQRGHNLYLPIPYGKSCKITYQSSAIIEGDPGANKLGNEAVYYNINYRDYEDGVAVESFSPKLLEQHRALILETQLALLKPFDKAFLESPQATKKLQRLAPGETAELTLTGARCITNLSLMLSAEDQPQALRSTVLELAFDGHTTLTCPVGDFFGTGYAIHPYETWYTKVFHDGRMIALWRMPFQRQARLRIRNLGAQTVTLNDLRVHTQDWRWDERSMYFGGSWKQFHEKQTGGAEAPVDLNFNTLEGQGVYVGDAVSVFNTDDAWWGEGDEKIYVDGEDFPSHFGTGTEDYYGYAWCLPAYFDHPFIAQPDGSGNLVPGTSVNLRYRALDAIPFRQRLQMDMELWHWTKTSVNYAPTTLFYLRPDGRSLTVFSEAEARKKVAFAASEDRVEAEMKDGLVEGENMDIFQMDGGDASHQHIPQWGWHNERQLWWRHAAVGDTLQLSFISEKAYEKATVELQLTQANDYGQVAISLNGSRPVNFDGYAAKGTTQRVRLVGVNIHQGLNRLSVVVKGKHADARPGRMFGIDYLKTIDGGR